MKQIIALCDYKGYFGSRSKEIVYRSGMNKLDLQNYFQAYGYELEFRKMADIQRFKDIQSVPVLYTSQEDIGYKYKNYIEDVIQGIEIAGGLTLPPYKFLRANNNKVFMEILRKSMLPEKYQLNSLTYGCFEELMDNREGIHYPCVVKTAGGASSRGVYQAANWLRLKNIASKISKSSSMPEKLWDVGRNIKHKGYVRESTHRGKFVIQDLVPKLSNDWKVLVFYDRYYILRRFNRPGDFRASGSGLFSFDEQVDETLLSAAEEIRQIFNVPMISLDLALSEGKVILIEMQFLYFGSATLERSPFYFEREASGWKIITKKSILEEEYARSMAFYLDSNKSVRVLQDIHK